MEQYGHLVCATLGDIREILLFAMHHTKATTVQIDFETREIVLFDSEDQTVETRKFDKLF